MLLFTGTTVKVKINPLSFFWWIIHLTQLLSSSLTHTPHPHPLLPSSSSAPSPLSVIRYSDDFSYILGNTLLICSLVGHRWIMYKGFFICDVLVPTMRSAVALVIELQEEETFFILWGYKVRTRGLILQRTNVVYRNHRCIIFPGSSQCSVNLIGLDSDAEMWIELINSDYQEPSWHDLSIHLGFINQLILTFDEPILWHNVIPSPRIRTMSKLVVKHAKRTQCPFNLFKQ